MRAMGTENPTRSNFPPRSATTPFGAPPPPATQGATPFLSSGPVVGAEASAFRPSPPTASRATMPVLPSGPVVRSEVSGSIAAPTGRPNDLSISPPPSYVPPAVGPFFTGHFTAEMAQMICGSCRRLLSYQRGAKHVQCSCCQIVNLVLEANEVGQVRCGSCAILLMYPYGAPSVRCSSCHFVTDIGEHNRRPPLSVQQGRSPPPPNLVR